MKKFVHKVLGFIKTLNGPCQNRQPREGIFHSHPLVTSENGCPVLCLFIICISHRAIWVSSVSSGLCCSNLGNGAETLRGTQRECVGVQGGERGGNGGGRCQHPSPYPSLESPLASTSLPVFPPESNSFSLRARPFLL